MSEMIEKVAKAIWNVHVNDTFDQSARDDDPMYKDMAEAAIKAMREPTNSMIKSGDELSHDGSSEDIWKDMIAVALKK